MNRLLLTAAALLLFAGELQSREPWAVYKNCQLVRSDGNDADSVHVKADGKEYLFRLYFVDAPETETSFPMRVAEQAKYFGITSAQAIQLGNLGKKFTMQKLSRPFTVRTCMQDARGRSRMPRYFAFIETQDGDLAELLVANGLARVYGASAQPVGLSSPERQWRKLEQLERQAKQQKVGGWGANEGRMTARAATQPDKSGPNSFDAFFHPTRVADAAAQPESTPLRLMASAAAPVFEGGKFDVNTVTSAQLLSITGVGPVLAQRIIDARPFKSADDLRNVKGIGEKKFAQIRPHFQ
jgi:competence protein ComEA